MKVNETMVPYFLNKLGYYWSDLLGSLKHTYQIKGLFCEEISHNTPVWTDPIQTCSCYNTCCDSCFLWDFIWDTKRFVNWKEVEQKQNQLMFLDNRYRSLWNILCDRSKSISQQQVVRWFSNSMDYLHTMKSRYKY